jgi:putative peptidoglycan lipid II flippase
VGAGISLSRVTGFLRDAVFAFFFGTGVAADAYAAALRIPNVLRNLLGEGTLSASLIPVYTALLQRGDDAGARRLAGTLWSGLWILAAALSLVGILAAPWLTSALVPGWEREATELTVRLVRILFPMAGFMILGGWCLGILNSHRRFFLPFAAPVLWNATQILALWIAAAVGAAPLIVVLAWATLLGGALQFAVQVPATARLLKGLPWSFDWRSAAPRTVVRNFAPVVTSAGVFQVSSFVDVILASFVAHGAISALYYAQRLYTLPLSLFGIAVAAAALPELSRDADAEAGAAVRRRLSDGFRQILFFVFPSAAAFLAFGDLMVGLLYQRGDFGPESALVVSVILAAYAFGLAAAASVRLFASGFHAMLDTRTPLRYAVAAVAVGVVVGGGLLFGLRGRVVPGALAAAGLAAGSALGAWLNVTLLWRGLRNRIGAIFSWADLQYVLGVGTACLPAAAAALAAETLLKPSVPEATTLGRLVLFLGASAVFGVIYWAATKALGVARPGWIPGPVVPGSTDDNL